MLYLIKSFGLRGKMIYKVGFSEDSNIDKRMYSYRVYSPLCFQVCIRPGGLKEEQKLHLYLAHRGYKYCRLTEWYKDNDKVHQYFHDDMKKINKYLWKNRNDIFKESDFTKDGIMNRVIYEELLSLFGEDLRCFNTVNVGGEIILSNGKDIDRVYYNKVKIKSKVETKDEIDIEVDTFLTEFYKNGVFERKMKLYCEFVDLYKDNKKIITALHYKIEDPRFENYYNFYGTSKIRSIGYIDKPLRHGIINKMKANPLSEKIYLSFGISDRYSLKEIKEKIREIYTTLGITKAPKAKDIEEYFEVKKILLYDPITKIRQKGYELIRIK